MASIPITIEMRRPSLSVPMQPIASHLTPLAKLEYLGNTRVGIGSKPLLDGEGVATGDGQSAAFRGTDGRLAILHTGRDTFAVKEWLAADADARVPKDLSLANGVRCDAIGCIGTLSDGRLISMVIGIEAIAEDCTRAAIIVSAREVPASGCAATVVDRQTSREHGAVALHKFGDHFQLALARPSGSERPWTTNSPRASENTRAAAPRGAVDSMPREMDLSADD